ncbi:MAG: OpgC domain-containing protein, partial [Chloroflexota bacterium]
LSAWQVLFVAGLVVGYHRHETARAIGRIPQHWLLLISGSLAACAIALQRTHLHALARLAGNPDVGVLSAALFNKPDARIGRLIVFAIFAVFAFTLVTLAWRPLHRTLGWLLVPLGQRSLSAYVIHVVVVAVAARVVPALLGPGQRAAELNVLVQLAAVALVLVAVYAWSRLLFPAWSARSRATLPAAARLSWWRTTTAPLSS